MTPPRKSAPRKKPQKANDVSTVNAEPSKRFFVSMLTRDIELEDAILDLIDNCIDGVVRGLPSPDGDRPYAGRFAKIRISSSSFSIEDNCGGIPLAVARDYAFRMGRSDDDNRDKSVRTIGVYGIGMKRALFKLGRESTVLTNDGTNVFRVRISPEWLKSGDWKLPLEFPKKPAPQEPGTTITVSSLHPGVAARLESQAFIPELQARICSHYLFILRKGFEIIINDNRMEPYDLKLLYDESETGVKPYFYEEDEGGLKVKIVVGLNAPKEATVGKAVGDTYEKNRDESYAGWTVVCNDRVVLFGDKSRVTVWGDGIPTYHRQFAVITGLAIFESNDAELLPVTTTKRSLDLSSDDYLRARRLMIEGTRMMVDFTNRWKDIPRSDPSRTREREAIAEEASAVVKKMSASKITRKLPKGKDSQRRYKPQHLPAPPVDEKRAQKRVSFFRLLSEIREVSEFLFDDNSIEPKRVGDTCFEQTLSRSRARKSNKKVGVQRGSRKKRKRG